VQIHRIYTVKCDDMAKIAACGYAVGLIALLSLFCHVIAGIDIYRYFYITYMSMAVLCM